MARKKVNEEEISSHEVMIQPLSQGGLTVENLIAQAIQKKVPVETMERLMSMRRELKAEYAKEQFDSAMANFQSNCPVIEKKKPGGRTKGGTIAYYYAPLESIVQQVKGLLRENGFSYAIQTSTTETRVKVTCIVKHQAGHSESSDVEVPLGTQTSVMSAPQVVASAITFAKRYAFCNAFGILTGDEDNDGQINSFSKPKQEEVPVISYDQDVVKKPKVLVSDKTKLAHLIAILKLETDASLPEKIEDLTGFELKEENYPEIVTMLENIIQDRRDNGEL